MLISIFHWLLLVEGVADSIGFLTHLLGIHLYTKGSFLKTLALPFLALGGIWARLQGKPKVLETNPSLAALI